MCVKYPTVLSVIQTRVPCESISKPFMDQNFSIVRSKNIMTFQDDIVTTMTGTVVRMIHIVAVNRQAEVLQVLHEDQLNKRYI